MDICRNSFKKSANGGSFTSASLEESYQPFTRFVLKGVKVTQLGRKAHRLGTNTRLCQQEGVKRRLIT